MNRIIILVVISLLIVFFPMAVCSQSQKNEIVKIAVIIPEYHIESRPETLNAENETFQGSTTTQIIVKVPDPAGETELIKTLIESGYEVIDQNQIANVRYGEHVIKAIQGEAGQAVSLGSSLDVDVVIIGEAFSESAGRVIGGLISCPARVEARAIDVKSGRIIAADGKHSTGIDLTESIAGKKALTKAGRKLGLFFVNRFSALP